MFTYKVTFGLNSKVDNIFVEASDSMDAFAKVLKIHPGARMFGSVATRSASPLTPSVRDSIQEFVNPVKPPGTYTKEAQYVPTTEETKNVASVVTKIIKNNVIKVDFVARKRAS